MIVGNTIATLAEAVCLAEKAGIDATILPKVFAGGSADSMLLQFFGAKMAAHQLNQSGTKMHTVLKDLDTATELGRQLSSSLPMANTAAELIRLATSQGLADGDITQLIKLYSKN